VVLLREAGGEMIKETAGNLLRADAEALVNTVNTEGVMGRGIALQFKRAYPRSASGRSMSGPPGR
jgi:O-acetyl-ADP-ribose deacetylase (regulator of RNase III)